MGSPELKDSCIQAENCYKSACLNEGRGVCAVRREAALLLHVWSFQCLTCLFDIK